MEAEKELKLFWYIDFKQSHTCAKIQFVSFNPKTTIMLNTNTMVVF